VCPALGKLFDFLSCLRGFAPSHGDGGDGDGCKGGDLQSKGEEGGRKSVVAGDFGTLDRFAGARLNRVVGWRRGRREGEGFFA